MMVEGELTNVEIVLYALALLNGGSKRIPTETLAIKCYELSPSRFSWRLYPEYPDIDVVRVALFDAQKEKNGALVSGRYGKTTGVKLGDGWIFTPQGILWVEKNQLRIAKALKYAPVVLKRTERDKSLLELNKSTAFRKYIKDGNCLQVKLYEFTDCLEANLDTPPHILRDRMDKMKARAAAAKQERILSFLMECEVVFARALGK